MRRWFAGPVGAMLVVGFLMSGGPSRGAGPAKGAASVGPGNRGGQAEPRGSASTTPATAAAKPSIAPNASPAAKPPGDPKPSVAPKLSPVAKPSAESKLAGAPNPSATTKSSVVPKSSTAVKPPEGPKSPNPSKLPASASLLPSPTVASGSEDSGDEEGPSYPFACPECGYGASQGGFCPICHIPLVEITIDSPDTEQPLEDSGEDLLEDAEAVMPNP